MEVRKPGVWLPVVNGGLDARVVKRLSAVEPARKVVPGANIVAGEDIQPTKAAEEGVFGSPAPDPAQPQEHLYRLGVVESLDRGRGERPGTDPGGQLDDAARFCAAEAER